MNANGADLQASKENGIKDPGSSSYDCRRETLVACLCQRRWDACPGPLVRCEMIGVSGLFPYIVPIL